MAPLVRRLLIIAAVDGLILQPVAQRNHAPSGSSIKIDYKSNTISPLLRERKDEDSKPSTLEAHGIVGLLTVASSSYLISITRREQVAQIRGKPIYVITDVALIPLSSKADAETAITQTSNSLKQRTKAKNAGDNGDISSDEEDGGSTVPEEDDGPDKSPATPQTESEQTPAAPDAKHKRRTSVAEDVINRKGQYGRFAERWFSKKGWSADGRRKLGMSSEEDLAKKQERQAVEASSLSLEPTKEDTIADTDSPSSSKAQDGSRAPEAVQQNLTASADGVTESLTPKIVRTTKMFFSSKSFFFSYDYDISQSLARQDVQSTVPLYKKFEPSFFWNHHIILPFIEAGQQSYVLPLLQGFVGQRAFTVGASAGPAEAKIVDAAEKPEEVLDAQSEDKNSDTPSSASDGSSDQKDYLLTLISRRSTGRAGLRYLRRGVDDKGNVANSVETEQILSSSSWDPAQKTYSFIQIRGSIPLFFSQTPYSFKPIPVLFSSPETNQAAFKQHFAKVIARYGAVQVASLVDKHGTEAKIGEEYEKQASVFNDNGGVNNTKIGFEWFDFHNVCRGMKFENVSILMDTLGPFLSANGWAVQQGEKFVHTQSGVLRTNCMDCLDRTNVVQSATARSVLEQQLADQSIKIDLQNDPTTSWFNTLWADNGDAISRQYAGTAALKGDFTRTRKRNALGALTDFSLTLNRYYNNMFGDYFTQACIDYYLGNATTAVFREFETDMMSQDYALDINRIRQNAIDTCVKIVLEDPGEDLVGGWTLSCPHESNTLRTMPFEECVVLLTDVALYFCRFDWSTEKVGSFERVELDRVRGICYGTYITSTLAPAHMDEKNNVGFVVRYKPEGEALVRTNTRSMQNEKAPDGEKSSKKATKDEMRILAFKALPPKSSAAQSQGQEEKPMMEKDLVQHICEEIQRAAFVAEKRDTVTAEHTGKEGEEQKSDLLEEKDIISLAEAKKSTGYLEHLGYSLKKLVWT
ncbi:SacI homology domain-containing protein [Cryomyces antarcticus]